MSNTSESGVTIPNFSMEDTSVNIVSTGVKLEDSKGSKLFSTFSAILGLVLFTLLFYRAQPFESINLSNQIIRPQNEKQSPTITISLPPPPPLQINMYRKDKATDREGANAFLENGGVIGSRDPRKLLLCKLNATSQCASLYPSDMIDKFFVFLPVYAENQQQQENLYLLHQNFVAYLKSMNIPTVVLEALYAGQTYRVTEAGRDPWEIQLHIKDTFYYRENLLNVAIRKTKDWEYALWIDAHQIFLNPYWWEEGITKLEHYNNVQFFQTLAWLNKPDNSTDHDQDLHGVQYAYTTTRDLNHYVFSPYKMWNGNAVGVRREIYEGIDYVLDECLAGCCDCAFNVAGMKDHWDRVDKFPNYGVQLNPWIEKASKVFDGKVAIVRGRMYHFYHDHFFPWDKYLNGLGYGDYNLKQDLYRDSNFTLHIKKDSHLSELFIPHEGEEEDQVDQEDQKNQEDQEDQEDQEVQEDQEDQEDQENQEEQEGQKDPSLPISSPPPFSLPPSLPINMYRKDKATDREGANAFLENGGVIGSRDPRKLLLCKLNATSQCASLYPSDMIDKFFVFLPVYAENQQQQENLYLLHQNFVAYLKSMNIPTVVLEALYAGQTYRVTEAGRDPWEIQLQIDDTFYYRENLLNVAIRKTKDWEYALWIDAHQIFLNPYWWEEGITKLEHYNNVQFFQTLAWLNKPDNSTDHDQDLHGVQYAYTTTRDLNHYVFSPYKMWNGNAVGVRREIYEGIDYVLDECLAGCCDCAFNVAGMKDHWDRVDKFPRYAVQLNPWIEKASKVFDGKVAIVRGRMYHFYHDHFFPWDKYLNGLGYGNYNLKEDLYRDDNFTLHIKEGSHLSQLFVKHRI